jgi:hypothetical protein
MNPKTFELRHWTLASGVCLVVASPSIWTAFGWGWALVAAILGLSGIVVAVSSEMVAFALDRKDDAGEPS